MAPATLQLRRLRPDDLSAFFTCRLDALTQSPAEFVTMLAEERARGPGRFAEILARSDDDEVIRASINAMYVRPSHRRQGLAGALLDLALQHARETLRVTDVMLSLAADNEPARGSTSRAGSSRGGGSRGPCSSTDASSTSST